jgi:hypothetical protein
MMVKQLLSGSEYGWVFRHRKESCDAKRTEEMTICGCSHNIITMHGPINIKCNEYTFKLLSKYSFDFSNYNILWQSGYFITNGKFNKIKLHIE